jgi:glycosyltransferase involved in cell wall biosynthesis
MVMTMPNDLALSVVIPLYNEEESLPELHTALSREMEKLGLPYEILYVDDGSRDRSFEYLRMCQEKDPDHVRVIRFRRNFGQTAAIAAGFHHARGQVVVTLDADLQNDPKDIGRLLDLIREGYDVVSGWRLDRKDRWLTRKLPSYLANRLISRLTGVHLHDYGCTLKAYRKEVVDNLNLYGEMHRFIPALASWMGVRVGEIPVAHHPRRFGKSKYGLSRTIRVVLDLINVKFLLSYSTRPIQVFGGIGFLSFTGGLITEGAAILMKVYEKVDLTGNPLLYLGILLLFIGVQFVTLGLLGEMIIRTYHESRGKPIYVVRQFLKGDG